MQLEISVVEDRKTLEAVHQEAAPSADLACSSLFPPQPPLDRLLRYGRQDFVDLVVARDETTGELREYLLVEQSTGCILYIVLLGVLTMQVAEVHAEVARWMVEKYGASFGVVQNTAIRSMFDNFGPEVEVDGDAIRWVGP